MSTSRVFVVRSACLSRVVAAESVTLAVYEYYIYTHTDSSVRGLRHIFWSMLFMLCYVCVHQVNL